MKRNFPRYAVGLDSTLEAIRVKDYQRGLEEAAKTVEGYPDLTPKLLAHLPRIAWAIRSLKKAAPQAQNGTEASSAIPGAPAAAAPTESLGTQADSAGAVPAPSAALVDAHLDRVLRASGSALRHYTTDRMLNEMRAAMRNAMQRLPHD